MRLLRPLRCGSGLWTAQSGMLLRRWSLVRLVNGVRMRLLRHSRMWMSDVIGCAKMAPDGSCLFHC